MFYQNNAHVLLKVVTLLQQCKSRLINFAKYTFENKYHFRINILSQVIKQCEV